MNDIGIKARLLLMTLIPAGILAAAVGVYFSWQHLGDLQKQLLERGQLTAEHLQRPATEALLARQPQRMRTTLANTLNYQDVRAVTLYDADNQPLEHSGPQMLAANRALPESPLRPVPAFRCAPASAAPVLSCRCRPAPSCSARPSAVTWRPTR